MPNTFFQTIDEAIVHHLGLAIATAEGFFKPNSRPARMHNPGDLTLDIGGNSAHPIGHDGMYMIYANDRDGFEDLHQQIRLMLTGRSRIYKPTDTIDQMASKYTTTEQKAWASNVARYLGVPTSTRLCDIR